jgi:hypothetical protein
LQSSRSTYTRRARVVVALAAFVVAAGLISLFAPWWIAALLAIPVTAVADVIAQRSAYRRVEQVLGLEAIRCVVEPDMARLKNGWAVVLDKELPSEGRPVDIGHMDARAWLLKQGAADLRETYLRLSLEGLSVSTVRIREIKALVSRRSPSITQTVVRAPGGGDVQVIALGIDLDEQTPVARTLIAGSAPREPASFGQRYFDDRQATATRGEVLPYSITARSSQGCVEWTLEVEYSVDGKVGTCQLDDGGRPFRTSALQGSGQRRWRWSWLEGPPPIHFKDVTDEGTGGRRSP